MAQKISQGSIFGRIGSGVGRGLAEQLPKEIERGRLSAGLKDLGQQKDSTPFERFAQLSTIPGITPQMIQSGSELLRQEARGQALSKFGQEQQNAKPSPFNQMQNQQPEPSQSKSPSLTQQDVYAKALEGAIPRTEDEKFAIAGQKFNSDPNRYGGDPQKAIDYENQVDATNAAIAAANQTKHENLSRTQDNVVNRLKSQSERLNTKIPAELYSRIEDEAIQASKPRSQGGRGLTEQQSIKEYGDKLNDASRQFEKLNEIGNWGITLRPASESLRSFKELQKKMKELGETDNAAKEAIAKNKLSPKMAYAQFQPVSDVPQLNNFLKKLPNLEKIETLFETKDDPSISIPKTLEIAPELAKFVKENEYASPLAIAYELEKKGYNPSTFLQYVTNNSKSLNLRARQSEQASTPINITTPWNDWWFSSFSGIE